MARSTNSGATWSVTAVDTSGTVGQYTSLLALDSSTALVAYYDATNTALKVAKTTDGGATWPGANIVTVESANDVGQYASLAGVRSAALFISYYDATNGDLRLARSTNGGPHGP